MKRILLIDGNSLIFRAYYAQAYQGYTLTTSSGIPTNAVYSFANMITNLLKERQYYDVKVAFDKGKKTFRHEKLENYKAGRASTPDDLIKQFPIAREFLTSANIDWFELENYEADDLIGTMVKKAEKENPNFEIEIFSSDKDMFQLISNQTRIVTSEKGFISLFGIDELFDKYGISPSQIPDFKGLMGDSSDNLKGVEGVGPKTATKLIQEYNNLKGIYENIDLIKGGVKDKLIKDKESAFLCKEIATIDCEVKMQSVEFKELEIDINKMINFLNKYEMKTLVSRLTGRANFINDKTNNAEMKPSFEFTYNLINDLDEEYWSEENYLYIENFEENYHKGKILSIVVVNDKGNFILNDWSNAIYFNKFLMSKQNKKIVFDLKKTWVLFDNHNLNYNQESFVCDLMVAMYILDSNLVSNLQNINVLFNKDLIPNDEEVYGKGIKKTFDIDNSIKYSYLICKTICLKESHYAMILKLKEKNQYELFANIEFPLIEVLYSIEKQGLHIDRKELEKQTLKTLKAIDDLEEKMLFILENKIPQNFNFASPKQIKELLFDTLELKSNKKNSTDRDSLEKLIGFHPIIEYLIEHRKLSKLYSTYLRGFEKFIFSDNKIHTILHQTLTNTGRLSSSDPNIQNISVKDDIQKEVRKIFVCDPNKKFLSFDYSQIELRVLAELGDETNLLDIFNTKRDVHDEAARLIFHLEKNEKVDASQRRTAKIFNFGIIYGLSGYGLSNDLNVSILQANEYIQNYYKAFPKFENFKKELISIAKNEGYSQTISNRRRVINELSSPMAKIREFGKRIAVNMPIQGTAADILKVAMINIYKNIKLKNLPVAMVAQIHDEIIFEIPDKGYDHIIKIIEKDMKNAFIDLLKIIGVNQEVKVELEVNMSIGNNWLELK
ncbi:DNA polymerase I [Entomoplasma ellychniae]|uniref:DNA polymerase I n=1 Tax=Entomoplasma ellychniae TaxID=2114 RepID=A0A8E2QW01_9MOLU|nr:DNA polymerase I [Entomoplasma ellychniae]PPE04706.1 DNA polymerase I [Entomoplasma ellychniae]